MHGPAVGAQCPELHSARGPSCDSYSELASQPGLGGREAVSPTAIEQREEAAGMAAFEKALEKNLPLESALHASALTLVNRWSVGAGAGSRKV